MKKLTIFVLVLFVCFYFCTKKKTDDENIGSGKIRVILDTDANNELDDQHAIAYMLFNGQKFEVAGITVNETYNGGNIDKHFEEAVRVVKLCSLYSAIKVYKGATGQYNEKKINAA